MQTIRLDWRSLGIANIQGTLPSLETILQKHSEVFQSNVGTMHQFEAKLVVKPEAKRQFYHPSSVPYALKDAIKRELDRLEAEGIVERVSHSDWAAPVMTVPKSDGMVRLCGEYKVTVNPVLDVNQYPLPRPDNLMTSISGGKRFTKFDLTAAYQQMPLNEESLKYVTVNTHRGLYRYRHLPFGIASAPAVLQQAMDAILQGLTYIIFYLDDILITGSTDQEHLENLEEVLSRLKQHGIRLMKNKCQILQNAV